MDLTLSQVSIGSTHLGKSLEKSNTMGMKFTPCVQLDHPQVSRETIGHALLTRNQMIHLIHNHLRQAQA